MQIVTKSTFALTLDHKFPVIMFYLSKLRSMHHLKAEIIIFALMYGFDNICKSGIRGCKKI